METERLCLTLVDNLSIVAERFSSRRKVFDLVTALSMDHIIVVALTKDRYVALTWRRTFGGLPVVVDASLMA